MYFTKTPWWLKKLYPSFVWNVSTQEKIIYLTFDDGPHPTATAFVLNTLKQFNAKATFFCIGKNVELCPAVYAQIIADGHTVANHTQNHLNGWKTDDVTYINNIDEASKNIDSKLFRPPYGRITRFQSKLLLKKGYKIIMWDVLSGDFDTNLSKEACAENTILQTTIGSIIVFHDSAKAFERLEFTLPKLLDFFSKKGYQFKNINWDTDTTD
jgi:peptidoglycan/xylan/chitin deacetylase (PgdA/CDA1 family)